MTDQMKISGRSRKRRRIDPKKVWIIMAAVLLLSFGAGSTVAFILTGTDSKVNEFTPGHVDCQVLESFSGGQKDNVRVKNTGDVPAYLRAAVAFSWKDGSGNVYLQPVSSDDIEISWNSTGWVSGSDGFYYWTAPVGAGSETAALFTGCRLSLQAAVPEGYSLSVDIAAQAIQAEPERAVEAAWGSAAAALLME